MISDLDKDFLRQAIVKAEESVTNGGFPAGAIIVKDGKVIGEGISLGHQLKDPTSHGEIASIRDACKSICSSDLSGATLYASMQPCMMCFGSAIWSLLSTIVFACSQEKVSPEYYAGNYDLPTLNQQMLHPIKMIHIKELENESLEIVKNWEKSLRK